MKKKITALLAAAIFVVATAGLAFADLSPCVNYFPAPAYSSQGAYPSLWGQGSCDYWCFYEGKALTEWEIGTKNIEQCTGVQGQSTQIEAFDFESTIWGWCADDPSTYEALIYRLCCCIGTSDNPGPGFDKVNPSTNATVPVKIKFQILTQGVYWANRNLSYNPALWWENGDDIVRMKPYYYLTVRNWDTATEQYPQATLCENALIDEIWTDDAASVATVHAPVGNNSMPYPIASTGMFDCFVGNYYAQVFEISTMPDGSQMDVSDLWPAKVSNTFPWESFLAFDIPSFAYDYSLVSNGMEIQVQVTIQYNKSPVCAEPWEDVCSCVKTVGVFGDCSAPQPAISKCFPYFTPIEGSEWWNGIGIANMAGAEQTFTVSVFAGGASANFQVTVAAGTVTAFSLDQYKDQLTGLDLSQRSYVQVTGTNAQFDGFAMIGDGTQGMGYLPRCGACGTCAD